MIGAILVVVLVASAGNNYELKYFPFDTLAHCEDEVRHAVIRPALKEDARGVQAMFCIMPARGAKGEG